MRILLFFDLPSVSSLDQKNYRGFIKNLKKNGFYMMQESVYVKLAIDQQAVNKTQALVKSFAPLEGSIMTLAVTEKQFSALNIIAGEIKTDVITSDSRIIRL